MSGSLRFINHINYKGIANFNAPKFSHSFLPTRKVTLHILAFSLVFHHITIQDRSKSLIKNKVFLR